MNRHNRYSFILLSLGMIGCGGGSCPRAADATTASTDGAGSAPAPESSTETATTQPAEETKSETAAKTTTTTDEGTSEAKHEPTPVIAPEFPDHASVSQAIAAIPRGAERANIDPGDLAEPLQSQSVYEPCKVGAQHFKLKVAVWNGRAVGVDVETANKKLAECIDTQVRSIEWRQKVRSLNTVEYAM